MQLIYKRMQLAARSFLTLTILASAILSCDISMAVCLTSSLADPLGVSSNDFAVQGTNADQLQFTTPYILVDVNSGVILQSHRMFDAWYPASLTKLMTTYLAFEAMDRGLFNKNSPIKLSKYAVQQAPSRSGYRAGTILTLDDALKIMLVKSTNDIAVAIAEAISGSSAKFVEKMNLKAKKLGMDCTHFTSPNGLYNPNNYSTARDIAILCIALRNRFPQYRYYFSIAGINFGKGGKNIYNSNNLIGRFRGIDGMKTGFICASGYNLAATATRGGRTLLAVVLGASRLDIREEICASLLEKGFRTSTNLDQDNIFELQVPTDRELIPPNLRQNMCSAAAFNARRPFLDKDFAPIIDSPYITDRTEGLRIYDIQPLFIPKILDKYLHHKPKSQGKKESRRPR